MKNEKYHIVGNLSIANL